jgi:hypothetical protein
MKINMYNFDDERDQNKKESINFFHAASECNVPELKP